MDIKELEAFVYVVENSSFSRAAELLHLTQPTISSHISALERKLGIKLIVRTTKETFPSDAGKLLYGYAKEILRMRESATEALRSFSREMRGTISIAVSTGPSRYHLPHLLRLFRDKYPDITFSIQMEDSPRVAEMVALRSVEMGFCGARAELPKCVYREFARDRMVLITPNTPEFARYADGEFPALRITQEPFISREKTSGVYHIASEFLSELGIDAAALRTAVELHSGDEVRRAVSEGLGVSVVDESAAFDDCRSGRLLAFHFPEVAVRRSFYLAVHKNNILSPIAQAFYDFTFAQERE